MHTAGEARGSPREAGGHVRHDFPNYNVPNRQPPTAEAAVAASLPNLRPLSSNAGAEAIKMECDIVILMV